MKWFKNFKTRKQLKAEIEARGEEISRLNNILCELDTRYAEDMKELREIFMFDLGDVVYDLQMRNEKGHFTKVNPSLEHSFINEVVVDKKNYFKLVDRYHKNDVFLIRDDAEAYLASLCAKK